ncbi:MAG: glycosyltransferase [Pseudomonadota bacterium]|nr:glycosyltransferase [Pseudomonadota bacterium]
MSANSYAPVVLFTFNRLDHTQKTVKHLQQNYLAEDTDLIIYSDAARSVSEEITVLAVRDYLETIKGFKSIQINYRENNNGLATNIITGVTEILEKHKKIIVLEDDLITSKNFLCYMNQSLEKYQNNNKIFSISGYTMDLKSIQTIHQDNYLSLRPASWGWATWLDQWKDIDWEVKDYDQFIQNKIKIERFNQGGPDLTRMLKDYFKGKNNSWAIRWSYAQFKAGKYSSYPKISKIQNIGFGAEATHCKGINIYQTTIDQSETCNFKLLDKTSTVPQIIKEFKYKFSYTNKFIKKILNLFKK